VSILSSPLRTMIGVTTAPRSWHKRSGPASDKRQDELRQKAPERNQKLPPDALRCAIRFVHDNLDSKLKWDEMAAALGLDPFTFGRRFKLGTE